MATIAVQSNGPVPAPDGNGPSTTPITFFQKYEQEKDKRTGKGLGQYINLAQSSKYKKLLEDPWISAGTPVNQVVPDGGKTKFLIIGAGFGGILFAVNLIKAGFSADDLVIVDPAGGFGGTWYWNRYPGLMCDVESYIYCPMLEEMEYMPTEKYASGNELRMYCERICEKYDLHGRAMFQSRGHEMAWDAERKEWKVTLTQKPKGGQETSISISSEFVFLATGLLHNAKLADVEGADGFQGEMFHTARWNYDVTGGKPEDPKLEKLKDKKVAIVGTGATAIQAIPHLAKWAKELTVFQRTPSAVDERGNRNTDPEEWKREIATQPGWQKERNKNYFAFVGNAEKKPEVNMVNDGWTRMPAYSALIGGPSYNVTFENVGEHVARMHALDYPHSEMVRQRAKKIVQDEKTAASLQAWYAGWCKRPCFHDDYLPTFNRSNVTLVDTDGKGIDRVTPNGIEFAGKEYEADVLVWSTGFLGPGLGNAASKAAIHLTGKDGQTLEEHYNKDGLCTLHGVTTRGFPNLFWPGPFQIGASPNWTFVLETLTQHLSYIIAKAHEKAGSKRVLIEPTAEAEQNWTMQCLAGAAGFASISGCTPSYLNAEGAGDDAPMEEKMKHARASPWSRGIVDYVGVLEAWRADGKLDGIEVTPVAE